MRLLKGIRDRSRLDFDKEIKDDDILYFVQDRGGIKAIYRGGSQITTPLIDITGTSFSLNLIIRDISEDTPELRHICKTEAGAANISNAPITTVGQRGEFLVITKLTAYYSDTKYSIFQEYIKSGLSGDSRVFHRRISVNGTSTSFGRWEELTVPTNYVTIDSNQIIKGVKEFQDKTLFNSIGILHNDGEEATLMANNGQFKIRLKNNSSYDFDFRTTGFFMNGKRIQQLGMAISDSDAISLGEVKRRLLEVELTPGPPGEKGEKGDTGPQGPKGDKPSHAWSGTSLRFQNPSGTWGPYVNLLGPKGDDGPQGPRGPKGDMPDHRWSGSILSFQKPDGTWTLGTDLKGPKGDKGNTGDSAPALTFFDDSVTESDGPSKFKDGITITVGSSRLSFPTIDAFGTLTTNKPKGSTRASQTFITSHGELWIRRGASSTTWEQWIKVGGSGSGGVNKVKEAYLRDYTNYSVEDIFGSLPDGSYVGFLENDGRLGLSGAMMHTFNTDRSQDSWSVPVADAIPYATFEVFKAGNMYSVQFSPDIGYVGTIRDNANFTPSIMTNNGKRRFLRFTSASSETFKMNIYSK